MADTHTDPPLEHLDNDQLKLLVADRAQRLVNRIGGHTPEYNATNEQWRAEIVGAIELLDTRLMIIATDAQHSRYMLVDEKKLLEREYDKLKGDYDQVSDLYEKVKKADKTNHERYLKRMDDAKQKCEREKRGLEEVFKRTRDNLNADFNYWS